MQFFRIHIYSLKRIKFFVRHGAAHTAKNKVSVTWVLIVNEGGYPYVASTNMAFHLVVFSEVYQSLNICNGFKYFLTVLFNKHSYSRVTTIHNGYWWVICKDLKKLFYFHFFMRRPGGVLPFVYEKARTNWQVDSLLGTWNNIDNG